MCDLFLVLAQTSEGVTCFALPRVLPGGERNAGFQLQRLKDKLGNRSNASSEVEFRGAMAQMVGEPGRGVPTIIEMVNHTRLDCVIGAAAGLRLGVAQATWHAAHRSAFGSRLADQPLMRNVLADLAIESEAATLTALRLARAYDEDDEFRRLATAVMKYYVCKRAPQHAYVMALDVLRALAKTPAALEGFFAEVEQASGADARLDAFVAATRNEFSDPEALEMRARRVVERMALCLQGSLVVRHAPAAVADAFCAARLAGDAGLNYGTLPAGVDTEAIVARHTPAA
jgi:putative acyl-CoA dehydrogenase